MTGEPQAKKIRLLIDKEGRVVAEAFGFTGSVCLTALDSLLQGLGRQTAAQSKAELYLPDQTHTPYVENR